MTLDLLSRPMRDNFRLIVQQTVTLLPSHDYDRNGAWEASGSWCTISIQSSNQFTNIASTGDFSQSSPVKPDELRRLFGSSTVDADALGSSWNIVRKALDQWRELGDDWDYDDAVPPSAAQIASADKFITTAERHGVAEPRPYIAPDGEFGFHWDFDKKASVSFLREDRFLAFCPRSGQDPIRIVGPLDLASMSESLFKALASTLLK